MKGPLKFERKFNILVIMTLMSLCTERKHVSSELERSLSVQQKCLQLRVKWKVVMTILETSFCGLSKQTGC